MDHLQCVYCDSPAETWDHLVGLVKDSQLNGYGHQVGNLVPCCGDCNSRKGNQDWRNFLLATIPNAPARIHLERILADYLTTYAKEIDLRRVREDLPIEWRQYNKIKQKIFKLMAEADKLAAQLRLRTTRKRA